MSLLRSWGFLIGRFSTKMSPRRGWKFRRWQRRRLTPKFRRGQRTSVVKERKPDVAVIRAYNLPHILGPFRKGRGIENRFLAEQSQHITDAVLDRFELGDAPVIVQPERD